MKKRDIQKKFPHTIEARVLEAAQMPEAEVKKIAAQPHLFSRVTAEIEAERSRRAQMKTNPQRLSGALDFRRLIFAAPFVLLFIALGSGWLYFAYRPATVVETARLEPAAPPAPLVLPGNDVSAPVSEAKSRTAAEIQPAPARFAPVKSAADATAIRKTKPISSPRSRRVSRPVPADEEKFYFLPSAFPGIDDDDSAQIVREVLTRDELAALGVDLPVIPGEERFLTDLLYSASGNPRAYRIINIF